MGNMEKRPAVDKEDLKAGIKKGSPPRPAAFPRGGPTRDCGNCKITAINGTAFPPGTTTAKGDVAEDTITFSLTATPNPAKCPCKWSEVAIEYVGILTGAAQRLKRKNLMFPQFNEFIKVDPNNGRNPYFSVNRCTLTISVNALNSDLRAGINTQHAFFQGIPTGLKVDVKCNSEVKHIILNITDK